MGPTKRGSHLSVTQSQGKSGQTKSEDLVSCSTYIDRCRVAQLLSRSVSGQIGQQEPMLTKIKYGLTCGPISTSATSSCVLPTILLEMGPTNQCGCLDEFRCKLALSVVVFKKLTIMVLTYNHCPNMVDPNDLLCFTCQYISIFQSD